MRERSREMYGIKRRWYVLMLILSCCLFALLLLGAGCGAKGEPGSGSGETDGAAAVEEDAEAAACPQDGDTLVFRLDFSYSWTGPEGENISWEADLASNYVQLTASINPETGSCSLGGEATIPVIVTAVMPDGSMTGSGTSSVDVGGFCEDGIVKLTILETTGGTYTISAGGYSITGSTPQEVHQYDMEFDMNDVNTIGGGQDTIEVVNGTVTGSLESSGTTVPL